MAGRYRYNPCNNCCRTECEPGSTFASGFVRDGCFSPFTPVVGATVKLTIDSTGEEVATVITGSAGTYTFPITLWTAYRVVISKPGFATNSTTTFTLLSSQCNTTINLGTTTLVRNRIQAIACSAIMACGWEYISGTTGTISQAGSTTMTVTGEIIRGTGTDQGTAYFYFLDCNFLPNIPITFTATTSGPYTPSTATTTFTLGSEYVCGATNENVVGSGAGGGVSWSGRTCPYTGASTMVTLPGYICTPFGEIPPTPPPPNTARSICGKPWQVGNLSVNDPQVGGGTLNYIGCFGGTVGAPFPDGVSYKGQIGLIWEGTATYNSPGCSVSCVGPCTCVGSTCFGGTFPSTTATVNYFLYFDNFFHAWTLNITTKYRTRTCSSFLYNESCYVAQFADDAYFDSALGVTFTPLNTSSNGGSLVSSTCPPAIVLEFSCGPFAPDDITGSGANGNWLCENGKSSRTVTVTA